MSFVEVAFKLRFKDHAIIIFVCRTLPRDDKWSINNVCVNEINIFVTNVNYMVLVSLTKLIGL